MLANSRLLSSKHVTDRIAEEIEAEENRNFLIENGYKIAQHELENNYDGTFTLKPVIYNSKVRQRVSTPHPMRKRIVFCIKSAYGLDDSI